MRTIRCARYYVGSANRAALLAHTMMLNSCRQDSTSMTRRCSSYPYAKEEVSRHTLLFLSLSLLLFLDLLVSYVKSLDHSTEYVPENTTDPSLCERYEQSRHRDTMPLFLPLPEGGLGTPPIPPCPLSYVLIGLSDLLKSLDDVSYDARPLFVPGVIPHELELRTCSQVTTDLPRA